MEIKIAALVAASAVACAVFVGCSCGRSVDNSVEDMNQIEIESNVTVSSESLIEASSEIVTSAVTETSSVISESETETTSVLSTASTKNVSVQFVGQPGGRSTTTQPHAATKVVIVTVTKPRTTETTVSVTKPPETTMATQNAPDGMFNPAQDMCFTSNGIVLRAGNIQPSLTSIALQVSDGMPVHGGSDSYVYICDGFRVVTENMTKDDGSAGEFITEIVLTGDKVCTNKGIKKGSSIDEIYAAYGKDQCLTEDTNVYRYKTDDNYVMEFCTDGTSVTEIKYYMSI
ncbi:MAG: hypothetical protein ACI4JD_05915 [Ruminococcus sp.]